MASAMTAVCVMAGVLVSGALAADSDSQPLTGCLNQSGDLVGVAVGTTPRQPCGAGQRQVTWGLPGAQGAPGAAGLAGADGISGSGRLPREQIVFYDDMSENQGWSVSPRPVWGRDPGDHVLWLGPEDSVVRTVSLPAHDTIRIQAEASHFDKWRGEHAYLMVDGRVVWNRARGCPNSIPCPGVNVAGDDGVADEVGAVIDVTLPHTAATVTVEFGTTARGGDEDEMSLAIDNVTLSVGRPPQG